MPHHDEPLPDEAWEGLTSAARNDARKLAALARVAMGQGELARAYAAALDARALAPADPAIEALTAEPIYRSVPSWHVQMVREVARNAAYRDAIERAVKPGMRVLDIGAGTGLLAMIAARAGAGSVFTCEGSRAIADAAEEIIDINGFSGHIHVLKKYSDAIDVEADLGGPVDLLVSEILASDLLMEGVLRAVADASARLLKPGGVMIPRRGEIRVALAHWRGLGTKLMGDTLGFDLRQFNRLVEVPHRVGVGDPGLLLRSSPATIFDFDFARSAEYRGGDARLELTADGPVNGIVQWIRVALDDTTTYENVPRPGTGSAWFAPFWPIARGVEAGDTVKVAGRYTRDAVLLWGEG